MHRSMLVLALLVHTSCVSAAILTPSSKPATGGKRAAISRIFRSWFAAPGPSAEVLARRVSEVLPEGKSYLPEETIARADDGNKFEKIKLSKDPTKAFTDLYEYAAAIRAGQTNWEEIEAADLDTRLKWVGLLHRRKNHPGTFMMRMRIPNGIVTAEQMRLFADSVEPYGPDLGVVDITTRMNIQLRGVTLEDAADITDKLHGMNMTAFHSAYDNVRNVVGHPLAGIDPHEVVDTRQFANLFNDMVSLNKETGKRGNPYHCNLPRKFNIALAGSRDDFSHTHINDIGLVPVAHATTGELGFNVYLGGYMSIKRVAGALPLDVWVPAEQVSLVTLCEAVLRIFRDESERNDRQKARLMWLVEQYGFPQFKAKVLAEMASYDRAVTTDAAQPAPTTPFERRDILGVHAQKQPGKSWVGVHVPTGRLSVGETRQLADLAERYTGGELRLTCEQNVLLPNVDDAQVAALLAEPALGADSRLTVEPGHIVGHTVSCTGSQFCGLAMVETKVNAERIAKKLDALIAVEKPLRIHWTGCPNSCGQAQAADIGLMGGPAKKDGKAVPGCKIFVGGKIGEHAELTHEPYKKGIPLEDELLLPELVEIACEHFGATKK